MDRKPRNFGIGRHPTKYFYTQSDIADAAGRSVQTVRNAIADKKLDPNDFQSVARWIVKRHREADTSGNLFDRTEG